MMEEPTLTEQQLMIVLNNIKGMFLQHGILSNATMADYLYLMSKHMDPTPAEPQPQPIHQALKKD